MADTPSLSTDQRVALLQRVPLFASFDETELRELADLFAEEEHDRGAIICEAGDVGETFYLVASGELEVRAESSDRVARLGAGDFFGEVALLLGDRRTATVVVARATRLLALSLADFTAMYGRNARVLEQLSQTLARRLAQQATGQDEVRQRVIAVRADDGLRGTSLVATALAALITADEGRPVLQLRLDHPERVGTDALRADALADLSAGDLNSAIAEGPTPRLEIACQRGVDRAARVGLDQALATLRTEFPHVVVEIGHVGMARDDVRALADEMVEIVVALAPPDGGTAGPAGGPTSEAGVYPVLNHANPDTVEVPLNHTSPYVLPVEPDLLGRPALAIVDHLRDDPWSPIARTLQRLTRKLLGRSVGLALGGGAAFGISHVGVITRLEEAGIPVDLLVGTSMGAIVAVGTAVGLRPDAMADLARSLGGDLRTILSVIDLNPLRPGIISGDRIASIFEPYLGSAELFSDLVVPCRTVATDIETGERVTLDDGRLIDAARASSSIPILVAPARLGGRFLVDGAMSDPVPAGVVADMGADIVLAVNVVPQIRKDVTNVLSRLTRRVGSLNPLGLITRRGPAPNLLDVTMNAMQTLQYELGQFKAVAADVIINPDLADFTWIEFYRPDELMERGAEATERALPEIERVLAERATQPTATALTSTALTSTALTSTAPTDTAPPAPTRRS